MAQLYSTALYVYVCIYIHVTVVKYSTLQLCHVHLLSKFVKYIYYIYIYIGFVKYSKMYWFCKVHIFYIYMYWFCQVQPNQYINTTSTLYHSVLHPHSPHSILRASANGATVVKFCEALPAQCVCVCMCVCVCA